MKEEKSMPPLIAKVEIIFSYASALFYVFVEIIQWQYRAFQIGISASSARELRSSTAFAVLMLFVDSVWLKQNLLLSEASKDSAAIV